MYYIGIDIGGTNLKAGLVDENYQIVAVKKAPLRFTSMEQMGETLAGMALALVEDSGVDRAQVASVGMGFPGPVDNRAGVVIKTVNIPIRSMPVSEMFRRRWDIPVYLGNDADCAALGEYYHYGEKLESLILVTLGTGIGTGIILNGKIQSGCNGFGGEGGHIVIVHGGEPCTCGRRGCWERYASTSALVRRAVQTDPALDNGRALFAAARQGDAAVRALLDDWIVEIAEGLAGLVHLFNPQLILIGGGVSSQQELLIDPLAREVRARVMPAFAEGLELRPAALANDAGLVGAVRYFLNRQVS